MFLLLVSDNESEHENEEEEWEAQQIRKGVTGAQVKAQYSIVICLTLVILIR